MRKNRSGLPAGNHRSTAEVEKASAGVRAAKREYIPDIEALPAIATRKTCPFSPVISGPSAFTLAMTCSTEEKRGPHFGNVTRSWPKPKKIWPESGTKSQSECKLPTTRWSARSRWSRFLKNCSPPVRRLGESPHSSYNRALILRSQADAASAQEFEAQTLLLQSQLEYAQAQDELTDAIGQTAK
jgi:hypothetical protein